MWRICFWGTWVALMQGSCTSSYYDVSDFQNIIKYDTHVHLDGDNTALAVQAKEDRFVMVTINTDVVSEPDVFQQFEYAVDQRKAFPDQVLIISSFDLLRWNLPEWKDEVIAKLEKDFDAGALGIKIWKSIGMTYRDSLGNLVMVDNPRFDKIIDYVKSRGKVVVGHLGEPRNCWLPLDSMTVKSDQKYFTEYPQYHMYLHPEFPSYEDQIDARDRFLDKHPDLMFVGAHLGSLEWSTDELAKRLDKYPNMAVDMAERICHWQYQSLTEYEKVRRFILKYQDRLIYGTDLYVDGNTQHDELKKHAHEVWTADWRYFVTDDEMTAPQVEGSFKGLKLPREVVDKIYYANARKWFRLN